MRFHCCLFKYVIASVFIGLLVAFHRPGSQLHNLALPSLGDYVLLSLSKSQYNPIYTNFTINETIVQYLV